ncbi:hypothetical protein D9M68_545880 [compost metagenome]
MLAAHRLPALVVEVGARDRRERFAVAEIRRPAVVRGVHQAEALGSGQVGLLVLALGGAVRPVPADARQEDPVVELDLVLRVEAQLLLVLLGRIRQFVQGRVAVFGMEQVQRRTGAAGRLAGFAVARVVHAEDHRVLGAAPVQLAFEVLVGQQRAHAGLVDIEDAVDGGLFRIDVRVAAAGAVHIGIEGLVVDAADRVAEVLADFPGVVELVFEQPAHAELFGVVGIEARFAGEAPRRDAAIGVLLHRTAPGQERLRRARAVFLPGGLERQRGGGAGAPGQGRRQQQAVVRRVLYLGVAVASQGDDAIQPLAVFAGRAGQVGPDLAAVVVAQHDADFALRFFQRALADQVDDAAGAALSVQHGGGAAQHLDALHRIHLGARIVEAEVLAQPVQVLDRFDAADAHIVGAVVHAIRVRAHPGGIVHGVLDVLRALVHDLVARNHGDGLGRFRQRRVGLGAGGAARGHVPVDRAEGGFVRAGDLHGGQNRGGLGWLGVRRVADAGGQCGGDGQ